MLTKSKIMAGLQCPRRLWLQVHRKDLAAPIDSPTIRQGNEVDKVAQQIFPDGVLIDGATLDESLALTTRAMTQPTPHIYQATVAAEQVLIKADILSRAPDGWVLTEVKAATRVKPEYLPDVAVQAWVLRRAGVAVTRVRLAHVDTDFVYPGNGEYDGLLKAEDLTAEAAAQAPQVVEWIGRYRQVLAGPEPMCDVGSHCNNPVPCEFAAHCDPYKASNQRPDVLPRIVGTKLAGWRQRGILELAEVPDDEINDQQRMVKDAHLRQARIVSGDLASLLAELPYPRFYLDFETSSPALPRFVGMRPYRHIAFQWSCHVERADGTLEHREFLAPDAADPRERFVRTLIAAVETDGPICVWYASFEKGRLAELAEDFPDHAGALDAIANRIVDLHPIFVRHYYDPGMNGSWSIKNVLPTIDPELSYDRLAGIREGGAAMEAYMELLDPKTDEQRRTEVRTSLSIYCAHDTMAMVKLTAPGWLQPDGTD